MIEGDEKQKLIHRIRRVEGQLGGVRRMVEEDTYCVSVLTQLAAVEGALKKVSQILLGAHIQTCVSSAFESGDPEARAQKLDELMEIFGRYGASSSSS